MRRHDSAWGTFFNGVVAFGTPGRKGIYSGMRCVRLRCDFLKFIKKQMPHFTLFRTIGICFFINFENQHPRPKTAHSRIYTFVSGLFVRKQHVYKWFPCGRDGWGKGSKWQNTSFEKARLVLRRRYIFCLN